ncbi:MAG: DUF3177 family protein [Synechococcaceae cyanobacterium]|nr:DUF3177 family protein [Synechococcaceae cyanobacterium]
MPDLLSQPGFYRTVVWLDVRLGILFAFSLPLVLLIWSAWRREPALLRLLDVYWKAASLYPIALLLLTDNRPLGFMVLLAAPLLSVLSLWFWVDLNEELADMPAWRALPLTVRLWRWALTFLMLPALALATTTLRCAGAQPRPDACQVWREAPLALHGQLSQLLAFVFGGTWTPGVAAFVGYVALVAYVVGLLQWLIVRLPRQGRVAGGF